jgi:hypothetical protein
MEEQDLLNPIYRTTWHGNEGFSVSWGRRDYSAGIALKDYPDHPTFLSLDSLITRAENCVWFTERYERKSVEKFLIKVFKFINLVVKDEGKLKVAAFTANALDAFIKDGFTKREFIESSPEKAKGYEYLEQFMHFLRYKSLLRELTPAELLTYINAEEDVQLIARAVIVSSCKQIFNQQI